MSLRSFLTEIEDKGEVIHITDGLSTRFEISAVLQEFQDGPVLLFDNVEGYTTKVVGNICGTRSRIAQSIGVDSRLLCQRLLDAMSKPVSPRIVDDGPVKEVQEKPNLHKIPVLKHFEGDAGPYITSAVISARSPDKKVENVSIHRLQVLDEKHLAIRLVPRHLYRLWSMARGEKRDLEIAISIGLHPAVLLAAASSPPFGISEFGIANSLLGDKLELVRCSKVDVFAPAEAELILEGRISFAESALEGPFVDIVGTYDIQREQPVVEVVNILHREDYIYQALLPGGSEHKLLMGLPREAAIYSAVSNVVPRVNAVNLTSGGCGWLHAIISIEKQTDGDGKNAILAAFAGHPSLKHVVIVDGDVDVFNMEEVEWAIATRFQADEDLIVITRARGSTLDPSGNQRDGLTAKIGIDATRPLSDPAEKFLKAKIPLSNKIRACIEKIKTGMAKND
ncbi:MAG: UbiD family decarboxylase [Nitrososphaerota archaeon]|nr:UbiD family decarboxylase [Candidatus Bathyarchaeota archaeon]MDW8048648.1 UbiD family decarboxylase [Nitrososphaerota archaeon]